MFGNKELQNEVNRLTELNASNESVIAELNSKIEELSPLAEQLESAKASNKELQENMSKVNGLNEELSAKVKLLEEEQENLQEKISASALNIVSQMGHEPVEVPADDPADSPNLSVTAQYMSIKDPQKRFEFFQENKTQLKKLAYK